LWCVSGMTETGSRNREAGLGCQDAICHEESGSVKAIALADGTGETEFAEKGAYYSARVLARLISKNFDELWEMDDKLIQFNVITNVRTELYGRCDEYGVRIEEMHSTLLGLAVDEESGNFIAVHLGDGRIEAEERSKNGRVEAGNATEWNSESDMIIRTISFPENGLSRNRTYLTSMCGAGKHVRIVKGSTEEYGRFILKSDGWENPVDDKSFIALTYV